MSGAVDVAIARLAGALAAIKIFMRREPKNHCPHIIGVHHGKILLLEDDEWCAEPETEFRYCPMCGCVL
jgi:hypothetical protein